MIDREGFNLRIVDLPVHAAEIENLQAGSAGQVFFEKRSDGKSSVQRFDFKDRKTETVVPEVDDYFLSFDGKKILFKKKEPSQPGSPPRASWSIVASSGKKPDAKDAKDAGRRTASSSSTRSPCASTRAPSGPRSSTRPGA